MLVAALEQQVLTGPLLALGGLLGDIPGEQCGFHASGSCTVVDARLFIGAGEPSSVTNGQAAAKC
jgi:hypothetical protein